MKNAIVYYTSIDAEDNQQLQEERGRLLALQQHRELSREEKAQLDQIQQLCQQTARANVKSVIGQRQEPNSIGLRGSVLQFDDSIRDREGAMQALARINLPGIQDTLVQMTGYSPSNMPRTTALHYTSNFNDTQAAIVVSGFTPITYNPQNQRLRFRFAGLSSVDGIDGNVKFMEEYPDEAKGIYFHELGHLWTSRICALDQGRSETYIEAFGEIFRSAAALQQGAHWEQAAGCQGYDILHGSELPNLVIPHWQNRNIPLPLYHAGRFAVCNKLIEYLGGLNEQTLHGLSKACDVGNLPCQGETFTNILDDIERETGVKDFANNVLHDPALQFGGMKPGPVVLGLPSADKNAYRIECFSIVDPNETWGTSKRQFPENCGVVDVNSNTFDFIGVQIHPIPFTLLFESEEYEISMKINVTSGEIVASPEKILDLALMANLGWPAGVTSISFSVFSQPFRKIGTKITISERQRSAYQKKKGVKFRC